MSPAVTAALVKKGFTVNIEKGAGEGAKFRDEDYLAAGANIVDGNKAFETGKLTFENITEKNNFHSRDKILSCRHSLESASADGK